MAPHRRGRGPHRLAQRGYQGPRDLKKSPPRAAARDRPHPARPPAWSRPRVARRGRRDRRPRRSRSSTGPAPSRPALVERSPAAHDGARPRRVVEPGCSRSPARGAAPTTGPDVVRRGCGSGAVPPIARLRQPEACHPRDPTRRSAPAPTECARRVHRKPEGRARLGCRQHRRTQPRPTPAAVLLARRRGPAAEVAAHARRGSPATDGKVAKPPTMLLERDQFAEHPVVLRRVLDRVGALQP